MAASDKFRNDSRVAWQSMLSQPAATSSPSGMATSSSPRSDSSTKSDEMSNIRVKLMCSYGGRILPRPSDSHLRYTGGETRIVVVDRAVTLPELLQKLRKVAGKSTLIKYQLPGEDLDALVSVKSEEDLDNMMEEYDRLMQRDAAARLRVFLFPTGTNKNEDLSDRSSSQQFIDALNGVGLPQRRVSGDTAAVEAAPPGFYAGDGVTETMDIMDDEAAIFHFPPMSPQRLPPACIPVSVEGSTTSSPVFCSPEGGIGITRQQRYLSSPTTRSLGFVEESPRSRAAMASSSSRLAHARQVVGGGPAAAAAAAVMNPVLPGMSVISLAHPQQHLHPAVASQYPLLPPEKFSAGPLLVKSYGDPLNVSGTMSATASASPPEANLLSHAK